MDQDNTPTARRDERLDDPTWMTALYVAARCSVNRISAIFGCSDAEVKDALRRHGIEMRGRGSGERWPQRRDPEWMVDRLVTGNKTLRDVARELGCSEQTVGDAVREPEISAALERAGWDPHAAARASRGAVRDTSARFGDAEILAAVERLSAGGSSATLAEIAAHLGVASTGPGRRRLYQQLARLCARGEIEAGAAKRAQGPGRPSNSYRPITTATPRTGAVR